MSARNFWRHVPSYLYALESGQRSPPFPDEGNGVLDVASQVNCHRSPLCAALGRLRPLVAKRMPFPILSLVIALLFSSCVGSGNASTNYRVATDSSPSGYGFDALLQGVLAGHGNIDGTACFSVTNEGITTVLVWPHGYSASGSPLRVLDQNGYPVGTVGDSIHLRGGLGPDPASIPVLGCSGAQPAWLVTDVVPLANSTTK